MATIPCRRTTETALSELHDRISQHTLRLEDWPLLGSLVFKEITRVSRRKARMAAKSKALANKGPAIVNDEGGNSQATTEELEASCNVGSSASDGDDRVCEGDLDERDVENRDESKDAKSDMQAKGHGRNGSSSYAAAEHCIHTLASGVIGTICEVCRQGRMSAYREKLIVVLKGQPLFGAAIHHIEQARCRQCGTIVRAPDLPAISRGFGSTYITYEWSACAMLLVMHYFSGMPFSRIESLQAGWGIPLPDANAWHLADGCADLLFPLYRALEKYGVNHATTLRIDDTGAMIVAVKREIREEVAALEALGKSTKNVRTGINATGVYLETEQGSVLLFFTGRHHAGEIIDQIFIHRAAAPGTKLIKVSDAASKNFTHAHPSELEEAVCNAHAYLKFRTIKDKYPQEFGLAGEVYKRIFDNDDVAKSKCMSPKSRMLYHREHSLPEMERLKAMCCERLESKLVEPSSPLWEPLTFIINQWSNLTKFCDVPGIPLDSNVVEQMLIIPVRYLAASFNYKTQNGADVGDRHMSLIATANANGIEPVAYLTECLANHEDLAKRPEYYFPWVYRARLEATQEPTQAGSAVSANSSSKRQTVMHPLRPGPYRKPVKRTSELRPLVTA